MVLYGFASERDQKISATNTDAERAIHKSVSCSHDEISWHAPTLNVGTFIKAGPAYYGLCRIMPLCHGDYHVHLYLCLDELTSCKIICLEFCQKVVNKNNSFRVFFEKAKLP